jgi:hypothetical protein
VRVWQLFEVADFTAKIFFDNFLRVEMALRRDIFEGVDILFLIAD